MKKCIKIFLIIFVILVVIILIDTIQAKVFDNRPLIKITEDYNSGNVYQDENGNKNEVNETMENVININVSINSKKYNATIENNETAKEFISQLPQEFNMKELNGNEKYVYMDNSLPTNPINPRHIESGDIMLYGSDCLVIFYKSFDTNYNYTKIGHINNLPDLGNDNVIVKFEK